MSRRLSFFVRWSWLLGIALFVPISLPAGGVESDQQIVRFRDVDSTCFAGSSCFLCYSPSLDSDSLRKFPLGTPLRVLRRWQSNDGNDWLQVQAYVNHIVELPTKARRGWIRI